MDFKELQRQIPNKERGIKDLLRYIETRTDDNSNYNLLLGAGCSVNSGIRSASTLIEIWRDEILSQSQEGRETINKSLEEKRVFLKSKNSDWYDPGREYSSLFERRYDLQRQRRMFVESEVSKAFPSIGYAYLTSLVSKKYFRTIFTTNFDDLINEAFYLFSDERPIVCAHDSSISSITVTSKRPKIIKLHGDYLFDDLKSTIRETESLEANMKSKFMEFAKEAGFIVIGYSGADRSIMDIFGSLLKNDEYLKGGIYWCLRSDADIPEELRRLFWRDRAYYVKIDGFDETFAELFHHLNDQNPLPDSLTRTTKSIGIVEKLLESPRAVPETTELLKTAKRKLQSLTKRSAIANQIVQSKNEDGPVLRGQADDLTDDELLVLTETSNLISDGNYDAAISKLRKALSNECRKHYKRRLITEQINAFRFKGDDSSALTALENLINLNPKRGSNYLLKASIEADEEKRLEAIQKAIELEPYLSAAHFELARWFVRSSIDDVGEERIQKLDAAIMALEKSIELHPSLTNAAWNTLIDTIGRRFKFEAKKQREKEQEIINRMSTQNPDSYSVLSSRLRISIRENDRTAIEEILHRAAEVESRHGLESVPWVAELQLEAYGHLRENLAIERRIAECADADLLHQDSDVACKAALVLRKSLGDEARAEKILVEALKPWNFDTEVFQSLFDIYLDTNKTNYAESLLTEWGHRLRENTRLRMRTYLQEKERNYTGALSTIREREQRSGRSLITESIYLHLCIGDYVTAEQLSRSMLSKINYSTEADTEIINLEFARKKLGKKPDHNRLEQILSSSKEPQIRSVIFCILDKRSDMIREIKESYEKDKTFIYLFRKWPIFSSFQSDSEVLSIFSKHTKTNSEECVQPA